MDVGLGGGVGVEGAVVDVGGAAAGVGLTTTVGVGCPVAPDVAVGLAPEAQASRIWQARNSAPDPAAR
jgi:hypothetical protein